MSDEAVNALRELADGSAAIASRFAPERANLDAQRRKLRQMYEETAEDSPEDRDRRRAAIRELLVGLDASEAKYEAIESEMTAEPLSPVVERDRLRVHNDLLKSLLWTVLRECPDMSKSLAETITAHLRVPKLR